MGTLRDRSDGMWGLVVSTGLDPRTGKYGRVIHNVPVSGQRAVRALLVALEADVQNGLVTAAADPTFGDLLHRWMEHIAGRGRSDATLSNYQGYIDREIKSVSAHSPVEVDCS